MTREKINNECDSISTKNVSSGVLNCLEVSVIGNGDHREIKSLNASGHDLHTVDDISACVQLSKINLSRNKISSLDGLRDNVSLQTLDVSHNTIKCIEAGQFSQLNDLRFLNLSHNDLKKFPSLPPLHQLGTLLLNHNQLHTTPNLRGLNMLRTLVLSHNSLHDVKCISWSHLSNLRKLSLSHNKISSLDNALLRLNSLEELRLNGNRLREIPPLISHLGKLKLLDLGNNLIDGELNEVFQPLRELRGTLININMRGNGVCEDENYVNVIKKICGARLQIIDAQPLHKPRKVSGERVMTVKTSAAVNTDKMMIDDVPEAIDVDTFIEQAKKNAITKQSKHPDKKVANSGVVGVDIVRHVVTPLNHEVIEHALLAPQRDELFVAGKFGWESEEDTKKTMEIKEQKNSSEYAPMLSAVKHPYKKKRRQKKKAKIAA